MSEFIDLNNKLIHASLPVLLQDKTTKKNIVFATDSYASLGSEYQADREITVSLLQNMDLKPRILKSLEERTQRTRKKAEVFTPAWLCCKMNNHCDDEWFGQRDVFNHLEGDHWSVTENPIAFPKKKTWKKYVDSRRLEITCGEAPYVVSRYDAATGTGIDIPNRIGILDRKLRVVNENAADRNEWLQWTLRAFQSVYGYEWQGDSLLIARINLLMTFVEYYRSRWGNVPENEQTFADTLKQVANVIAWNFWQMDGLSGTVPYSVPEVVPEEPKQMTWFDFGWSDCEQPEEQDEKKEIKHQECRIFDWRSNESVLYSSLKKG